MKSRIGYCWNRDYCPVAHAGTLVRVEDSALFVCPECARPLRAASTRAARFSHTPRLTAGAVVLLAALAAAFELWPSAPKPARLQPVWVRMEPAPQVPAIIPVQVAKLASRNLIPVEVTPLASRQLNALPPVQQVLALVAPAPVVALVPELIEVPSVLMRLTGDPALADQLVPLLAQAFLQSTGDQEVEILRSDRAIEVRGRSAAGLEAVIIVAATTTAAFAGLANGGAEVVFATRPPTTEERQALGKWREDDIAGSKAVTASLFLPVPSDPVAVAFVNFAGSPRARAEIAAAGFAPPVPPAPAPKPAAKKAVPPPAPAAPEAEKAPMPPAAPPKPAVAEAPPSPKVPEMPAMPPAPPAPAVADATAPGPNAAPPGPRAIMLPAGSKITFGPLKDVDMPAANPRMVFLQPGKTPRPPGKLQVDCMIQTSGVPTDCRQVSEHGDEDVSGVILQWLGSGAIRYSPATKDGHPVEERRVLTVNFREPAAHDD